MDYKINYTFNYDGRQYSSFEEPLNGILRLINKTPREIPIELIFPRESILTEIQKEVINEAFVKYNRPPYF